MERNLAMEVVRVTEAAALAAARLMGRGDNIAADQAAVTAMRKALSYVQFKGRVVIGEGERDEAPMLYIGEEVGASESPKVDIAVDPLEGTNIVVGGRVQRHRRDRHRGRGRVSSCPRHVHAEARGGAEGARRDRHHGDPDGKSPQDRQGPEGLRRGPLRGDPRPAAAPGPDPGGPGGRGADQADRGRRRGGRDRDVEGGVRGRRPHGDGRRAGRGAGRRGAEMHGRRLPGRSSSSGTRKRSSARR